MPIRYSIDRLNGRLLTHADGIVTFDDISAHVDIEQREHNLNRPELIDARGATTNVTVEQVRRLVQRAANMLRVVEVGPTAIVTDDPFTLARMYSLLTERDGIAAEVFRDVASANRWLDSIDAGQE
jgi:hypothetical protein